MRSSVGARWLFVFGLVGLLGCEGPAGPAGETGATGPTGPAGPTGEPGPAGASLELTPLSPGNGACPSGGVRLQVGDGVATYTCNGANGMDGLPGIPGPTGDVGPIGPTGPTGSPGLPGTTGQDLFEALGTGQLVVTPSLTTYTLVPGLMQTVNVPAGAVVYVSTSGGIQSTGATGSTCSVVDVGIFADGSSSPSVARRVAIANSSALAQLVGNWSMARSFTNLSAGSHTFVVGAVSGMNGLGCASSANVSSSAAPQLQGVLTVMILGR